MIKVRIRGGLGNQMFQYAFGRFLSLKTKSDLIFDITPILHRINRKSLTFRNFDLQNFNVIYKLDFCSNMALKTGLYNLFFIINFIFSRISNFLSPDIKESSDFDINKIIAEFKGRMVFDGYWQNQDFFLEIREILLKEFVPRYELNKEESAILDAIKNSNSIAVHVRRGDYVDLGLSNVCDINYYNNSIKIINNKISGAKFFVFSDDPDWAKLNFVEDNFFIVSDYDSKPCSDIFLMSQCKHQITANSSFSWWAAWLNENKEKIIIKPSKKISERNYKFY